MRPQHVGAAAGAAPRARRSAALGKLPLLDPHTARPPAPAYVSAMQGPDGTCDYSVVGLDAEDCNIRGYESCQRLRKFTDTSFVPPSNSEDLWSVWLCDFQSDSNPNKNAIPAKALTDDINALLQAFSNNGSMPAPTPDGKAGQPVTLKVWNVARSSVRPAARKRAR